MDVPPSAEQRQVGQDDQSDGASDDDHRAPGDEEQASRAVEEDETGDAATRPGKAIASIALRVRAEKIRGSPQPEGLPSSRG